MQPGAPRQVTTPSGDVLTSDLLSHVRPSGDPRSTAPAESTVGLLWTPATRWAESPTDRGWLNESACRGSICVSIRSPTGTPRRLSRSWRLPGRRMPGARSATAGTTACGRRHRRENASASSGVGAGCGRSPRRDPPRSAPARPPAPWATESGREEARGAFAAIGRGPGSWPGSSPVRTCLRMSPPAALDRILAGGPPTPDRGVPESGCGPGEAPDEVAGLVEAMLAAASPLELDDPAATVDIVGTGGSAALGGQAFSDIDHGPIVAAAAGLSGGASTATARPAPLGVHRPASSPRRRGRPRRAPACEACRAGRQASASPSPGCSIRPCATSVRSAPPSSASPRCSTSSASCRTRDGAPPGPRRHQRRPRRPGRRSAGSARGAPGLGGARIRWPGRAATTDATDVIRLIDGVEVRRFRVTPESSDCAGRPRPTSAVGGPEANAAAATSVLQGSIRTRARHGRAGTRPPPWWWPTSRFRSRRRTRAGRPAPSTRARPPAPLGSWWRSAAPRGTGSGAGRRGVGAANDANALRRSRRIRPACCSNHEATHDLVGHCRGSTGICGSVGAGSISTGRATGGELVGPTPPATSATGRRGASRPPHRIRPAPTAWSKPQELVQPSLA